MNTAVLITVTVVSVMISGMVLFDFNGQDQVEWWRVINDDVMGGKSESELVSATDSTAVFQGTLSLENNGGFASIRSVVSDFKLGEYDGLELRVLGDGRRYHIRLRTDRRFDSVAYKFEFDTEEGEWITVRAPFSEFVPTFRGRIIRDHPELDPAAVRQIGFLLGDKKPGRFRLAIDSVIAYTGDKKAPSTTGL